MIAACPKCSARYRVDPEKLGAEGARLRCAKCEAVFRVKAPQEAAAPAPVPTAQPPVAPDVVATPAVAQPRASAAAPATSPVDSARAVLVADPDVEHGKRTAAALASWGLQPLLVHDGVEAILAIQRNLPAVAVVDAALPKMFGFQVCELVKRNESLKHIHVVLIGAIHHADRYRRPPSELYGADAYLEHPDLPHGLSPLMQRFGLPANVAAPAAETPAPQPAAIASPVTPVSQPEVARPEPVSAPPQPAAAPPQPAAAPAQPVADDPRAEERARAERLARIIVSDIVLYHPEKFESAVRAGNVAQQLEGEVAEGRTLFNQRIEASLREERDFLLEELIRVAAERSK